MSPLADPEKPPVSPCWCRDRAGDKVWDKNQDRDGDRDRDRDGDRDGDRERSRCRRLVPVVAAAVAATALGAAAAILALLPWGREPPPQAPTAAHILLSPGSLRVLPPWRYEEGISGSFVSGDVGRDARGSLRVARGGLYLLYGQFSLTCVGPPCPPGRVVLRLLRSGSRRPLLSVPLALPAGLGARRARSQLAQAVGELATGDTLSLEWGHGGDSDGGWQLAQDEREGNFVGLLRIAGG